MKLFDDFEAVRFPEENLILVTHRGYLDYIYDTKFKTWKRYQDAGNAHITVNNYQDVSREEIIASLGGIFPCERN